MEMDAGGGLKFKLLDGKLAFDLGYMRTSYPGVDASLAYNYGEFGMNVSYDFGVAELNGRVRFSPDAFGDSGNSWNKRAAPVGAARFPQPRASGPRAGMGRLPGVRPAERGWLADRW